MKNFIIISSFIALGLITSCKKEQRNQSTAFSEKSTITNKKDIGQAD